MTVRELTLPEVQQVYKEQLQRDFPPRERKPFWRIESALRRGVYLCLGGWEADTWVVYAFFMYDPAGGLLLDYFAVFPAFRSGGRGSAFLRAVGEALPGQRILAEVDAPEAARTPAEREVCARRIAFYRRNGFADTGLHAVFWGVHYRMLMWAGDEPAMMSGKELCRLYVRLYGRRIVDKKLHVWPDRHRRAKYVKS